MIFFYNILTLDMNIDEMDSLKWYNKDGSLKGDLECSLYDNFQKRYQITTKHGKKNGLSIYWYENGQKRWEGTYKNEKLHGLCTWWDRDGQKRDEITYQNGELINEKYWDEDGSVMMWPQSSKLLLSTYLTRGDLT
jgi:antitoxin component YwqK of YwqJK toxin-antitoxin module